MRKLKVIPILSICIFIMYGLVSCRKEQTFTVKVFNPVTGEGYEGFEIQIVEETNKLECYGCSPVSNVIYTGTTNANGEVMVTERLHKNYSYSAYFINTKGVKFCYDEAYHEGYNTGGMKINLRMSKIEGSTAYLELVPCAELKLKINNVNCIDNNDKITFDTNPININDKDVMTPIVEYGCYQSQFPYGKVPSGEWLAEWEVTKNGIITNYDTIFNLTENQQFELEINY